MVSIISRIPKSGKVCISKQMVKICSKSSDLETEEPKPIKVQPRMLEYACEEASNPLVQGLEQRAKSGEVLNLIFKPECFSLTSGVATCSGAGGGGGGYGAGGSFIFSLSPEKSLEAGDVLPTFGDSFLVVAAASSCSTCF